MWIWFPRIHSTLIISTCLHYKYTFIHKFSLILNTRIFEIHQNTKFRIFLITKVYIPKYNVKKLRHNYNWFSWYFITIDDSHNKLNMEINDEVCTSLFIENFNKIASRIHVLRKCNQTTNPKFVIFNTRMCNFSTKYMYFYFYSQNVCIRMSSTFPKLPFLGNPQITINININNKSQQKFKIQTTSCPIAYSYS